MEITNRKINIYGTNFYIKFEDQVTDEKGNYIFGKVQNRIISISTKDMENKKLPKEEVEITVLHELFHAILESGQYWSSNEDEPLVEWLARSINSLIKQGIFNDRSK
jgi:Zn-dependent peptidase ImmA (M78 family)